MVLQYEVSDHYAGGLVPTPCGEGTIPTAETWYTVVNTIGDPIKCNTFMGDP